MHPRLIQELRHIIFITISAEFLFMRNLIRTLITAIRGTEKEFTTGSIRRAIFMLSVPMVLEMSMESLFAVVDVYWVSRIGVNAVATVGLTESVMFLVYSIAIGLSMAVTAMVARRIGEKDEEGGAIAAIQGLIIGVIFSLTISIVGIFFAEDILRLMGGEPELIAAGANYTRIMLGGNATVMFIFLLNAVFRGAGDASLALKSLVLANTLNLILDPLFIFGVGFFPELGVTGAAVATNIGRGVGILFQLYLLLNGRGVIRIVMRQLQFHAKVIRRLFQISLNGMLQYLIGSSSWIFLVRIISEFGSEAVAGYTIAIRIIIFSILPSWGMANAAATLVGQNLGAKKPERAEKSVWESSFYNMIFLLGVSVVFIIFAPFFIRIFDATPRVVEVGVWCLRITCTGYLFYAYGMVVSQAFNGAGDTKTPMWINVFCFWIVQIPFAYLIAVVLGWGPVGVFIAIALSESLLAIISIIIFRQGKWKEISL